MWTVIGHGLAGPKEKICFFQRSFAQFPKGNQVKIPEQERGYNVVTQVNLDTQRAAPRSVFFAV